MANIWRSIRILLTIFISLICFISFIIYLRIHLYYKYIVNKAKLDYYLRKYKIPISLRNYILMEFKNKWSVTTNYKIFLVKTEKRKYKALNIS